MKYLIYPSLLAFAACIPMTGCLITQDMAYEMNQNIHNHRPGENLII